MFNCYVVIWAGSPVAYFRTETAADNFIVMYNNMHSGSSNMKVEGRYIENIAF